MFLPWHFRTTRSVRLSRPRVERASDPTVESGELSGAAERQVPASASSWLTCQFIQMTQNRLVTVVGVTWCNWLLGQIGRFLMSPTPHRSLEEMQTHGHGVKQNGLKGNSPLKLRIQKRFVLEALLNFLVHKAILFRRLFRQKNNFSKMHQKRTSKFTKFGLDSV